MKQRHNLLIIKKRGKSTRTKELFYHQIKLCWEFNDTLTSDKTPSCHRGTISYSVVCTQIYYNNLRSRSFKSRIILLDLLQQSYTIKRPSTTTEEDKKEVLEGMMRFVKHLYLLPFHPHDGGNRWSTDIHIHHGNLKQSMHVNLKLNQF